MPMPDSLMEWIMFDLREDEALRLFPYRCPAGFLTIGYGRNLEAKGISRSEADIMLRNDIVEAQISLQRTFPGIEARLSTNRYRVIVEMIFNLGLAGTLKFNKMWSAIGAGDFGEAAAEMLDSKWARQVKGRAVELAEIMRHGI